VKFNPIEYESCTGHLVWGLRAFAKFRKATIIFVMSVRVSVRMELLGSHWMDFHEIMYLNSFRKSIGKRILMRFVVVIVH